MANQDYNSVIEQIKQKFKEAQADTLQGSEMIDEIYQKLNESKTPMLEIREFITGAEKVAADDASLKDIIDFCKKKATTGNLNYIINLCKEEHFINLKRAGHPSPEDTIKDIEKEFGQPAGIIEQGIKNGIFDKLNSKLLNKVKNNLGVKVRGEEEIEKDLKESFQMIIDGLCQYTPIGIVCDDKNSNKSVILCESDVLSFDKINDEFKKLTDVDISKLDPAARRLMGAVAEQKYNPETELFHLNENWDFEASLNSDGKMFIKKLNESNESLGKEIDLDNFKTLLLESIQHYENTGKSFNKQAYLHDGDNMIILMENANMLYKMDNLRVLKNLDESDKYILMDMNDVRGTSTPKILSISGRESKLFESFTDLCESIKSEIGFDVKRLFEHDLLSENDSIKNRDIRLNDLMEQQKDLNQKINQVKELKKLAEPNSPAMDKLNEQQETLESLLTTNLNEVNDLTNNFSLH